MKKTLSRATKGYLCKSSLTLSIATRGYLCIKETVEIIDKSSRYRGKFNNTIIDTNKYDLLKQEDDDIILLTIKAFIQCQETV